MPPKRTVAITGSHPVTREHVPWSKKHVDVWVFNEAAGIGWPTRIDAVFQIHQPPIFKSPRNRNDPKHWEWLQEKHDFPIYMQDEYPEVPSSAKYPLDEICDELLGGLKRIIPKDVRKKHKRREAAVRYFTSSVAYAIALAIYQGYERIELYGVEMSTETEYTRQRDGVTFWAGIALGRGIEFVVHKKSTLFKSLLYGYEGDVVINRQEFEAMDGSLQKALKEAELKASRTGEAVILAMNEANKAASAGNEAERDKWGSEYLKRVKKHNEALHELGVAQGAMQHNSYFIKKCDEMYAAIGGEKAIEAMMSERMKQLANGDLEAVGNE